MPLAPAPIQAQLPGGPGAGGMRYRVPYQPAQQVPRLILLDGISAQDIFNALPGGGVDRLPVTVLRIQNVSNQIVHICKEDTASTIVHHYVLAAGTANNNGTGGVLDLSRDQPSRVSVFAAAPANVVADIAYENNG